MKLIELSVSGGALIALVAILRFVAGKRLPRRLIALMWALAVLKLWVPVTLNVLPTQVVSEPVTAIAETFQASETPTVFEKSETAKTVRIPYMQDVYKAVKLSTGNQLLRYPPLRGIERVVYPGGIYKAEASVGTLNGIEVYPDAYFGGRVILIVVHKRVIVRVKVQDIVVLRSKSVFVWLVENVMFFVASYTLGRQSKCRR